MDIECSYHRVGSRTQHAPYGHIVGGSAGAVPVAAPPWQERIGPLWDCHVCGRRLVVREALPPHGYLKASMDTVFGDAIATVELGPGDALFIPAAWFHEVTALEPSITLSMLTFPWPNHFHFLGPTGSDDPRPVA